MSKKMEIEGVGPKIILLGVIYYIIAYFVNKNYPDAFTITNNAGSLNWLTITLSIIGLFLWISSVVLLLRFFPKGKLITGGPFRVFLNPLYNAFTFFIFPAIALYYNSWIFFGAGVVFLVATITIGKEEERYLRDTFGKEYDEYRKSVWIKL